METEKYYGICGEPWIDLEPYISTEGLDEVVEEMAKFLTLTHPLPTIRYDRNLLLHPEEFNPEHLGFDPYNDPTRRPIDGATYHQKIAYNSFFEPILPRAISFNLREQTIRGDVLDPANFTNMPHSTSLPKTMTWLGKLPMTHCRISVYATSPGQYVASHRDAQTHPGFNVPLIYINPLLKPFYIIDGEGKKNIVNSKIATFNPMDFHGMERSEHRSYFSIRVNGAWDESLLAVTDTGRITTPRQYFNQVI